MKITKLETDAPGLQAAFAKALKNSWCAAAKNTVHALELIYLARSNPLETLQREDLKPEEIKALTDLMASHIGVIESMKSLLLCCANETALWFAKVEWPLACKALQTEAWDTALHHFENFMPRMREFGPKVDFAKPPPFRPHSDFEKIEPYRST